jgi:hypothetical protein
MNRDASGTSKIKYLRPLYPGLKHIRKEVLAIKMARSIKRKDAA